MDSWVSAADWDRARSSTPPADGVLLDVVVLDPDLGAIAVARTADGREAYGAATGWRSPASPHHAAR